MAPEIVAEHVTVARQRASFDTGGRDFAAAMRSVIATSGYGHGQAYRRAVASVRCPVLLLHGERDRLVPVSVARGAARAHPSWSLVVLPDVGHVPQLEAPRETAEAIAGWLGSAGRAAAELAAPLRRGAPAAPGRAGPPDAGAGWVA